MGSIIKFVTGAVNYVFFSVIRGIFSLLTMAAAMHVWGRVNRCRGPQVVRAVTLLYFPIVAGLLMLAFFVAASIRFVLNLSGGLLAELFVVTLIVVPGGLLAGFFTGARTHLYQTRWGRIMMNTSSNHLVFWSASSVLAIFFLILPYGWLVIPTSGLLLFATLQLVMVHLVLYARTRQLQRAVARVVPGAPLDIKLDARGAALVSCMANLWPGSPGAAISLSTFETALGRGDRLKSDYALATLPSVEKAWRELAGSRDALEATLRKLVEDGVLKEGFVPGPSLARLFAMGVVSRTITLGHSRFLLDGSAGERQQHAVLAQVGGANLLFTGARDAFAIREVKAPDLLGLVAQLCAVTTPRRG